MNYEKELIVCIVNAGFSDAALDAAKKMGARGGTVVHARGTANQDAERFFHITVQPEKEMVMILTDKGLRDGILHALYRDVGQGTSAQGIAFALPVDAAVGLGDIAAQPIKDGLAGSNTAH